MEMSRSDVCGRQGFWTKVSTVDSEVEWKWRTVECRERGGERERETMEMIRGWSMSTLM